MADDPPYRAEYAKSGRSGCKSCKTNIAQASLRVAKMLQSPHFDGKVPNWYHYNCFVKKFKAKSEEEIGNFDSLRWDDQDKIRGYLTGSGTASKSKKGASKSGSDVVDGPKRSSSDDSEYHIEYSKSGRAKCRKCEEKIEKNVIRISKMLESEHNNRVAVVPHWHHVDCFSECRTELEADEVCVEDFPGFKELSEDDQKILSEKIKAPKKKKRSDENSAVKDKKPKDKKPKEEKPKEDDKLKDKLKKQNRKFWEIRDLLFKNSTNGELKAMLRTNNGEPSGGEDSLLDRCTDGLMFGALEYCPECKNGKLTYSATKSGYICTGNISGWTKCIYITQDPKRKPWIIPEDLKQENTFLAGLKLKVHQRKFPVKPTQSKVKVEEKMSDEPLQNRKIVFVGKLKESKNVLTEKIEALGGHVSASVTTDCFCCISSPGEVMKGTKKMETVESYDIPVVTEEYLDAIKKGGAQLMLTQYAIAPWGGERDLDVVDGTANKSNGKKRNVKEEVASDSKKSKMTIKGGAVVDPDSGLEDKYHVLSVGSDVYACVLGLVDLTRGTNSYYKLQILQHDDKNTKFQLFRSWGRVGTKIGGSKLEKFFNRENAIEHFKDVYLDKTGNRWERQKDFVKYPSRFYPLDIDYGQDDEELMDQKISGSKSELPSAVQNVIKMIFDVEAMKQSLIEFEIDLKKMPLGKLSKKQIETAYACLSECQTYLSDGITGAKVLDASNRFYTLIPHDFGLKAPPLLDKDEIITTKVKMLDSLLEIEIAYSLLKESKNDKTEKDPLDRHYESLKTDLREVKKDSDEYSMVVNYVKNTHAKTHSGYTLIVQEVFSVDRLGEKQRYRAFRDLHNRQLLWHGSRKTNFAGILSQGLRIAPPEAPVTGYMFGKGVYFADMVSKSANYCYTSKSNDIGLMLLCEVALGNMYEIKHAEHVTKLPKGTHSCKGLGAMGPDPTSSRILDDGTIVPLGKGHNLNVQNSSLLYNEYIVYDTTQINMKYLIQLKFAYKY